MYGAFPHHGRSWPCLLDASSCFPPTRTCTPRGALPVTAHLGTGCVRTVSTVPFSAPLWIAQLEVRRVIAGSASCVGFVLCACSRFCSHLQKTCLFPQACQHGVQFLAAQGFLFFSWNCSYLLPVLPWGHPSFLIDLDQSFA